ncbi:hypothetical protein C8T65DRAFT_286419 [Cerioporus squamosus]|nr:hypothetical protein C8T65DRAFT_286419 [Cerioporus squamosus]
MRYFTVLGQSQRRATPFILPSGYGPRRTATVGDMPAELLLEVFGYLVDTETVFHCHPFKLRRSRKACLWRASRACRGWRELIFSNARFWTVIDVEQSCTPLQMALKFSAPHTVDIRFHDPAQIPLAIQMLSENAQRIKSLIVVAWNQDTIRALTPLFERTPMPALQELWLNTTPHTNEHDIPPRLNPLHVPNLEALLCMHLRFEWPPSVVRNLRALHLGPSPHQHAYRYEDFLKLLQLCHRLEFLNIDRAFPLPILREDEYAPIVEVASLRHVYLLNNDPRRIRQLLSHILLSPFAEIEIHVPINCPDSASERTVGVMDLIPHHSICLPHLRTATRVELCDLDFTCWGPGGRGRLAVVFDEIDYECWAYFPSEHAMQCGVLLKDAPVEDLAIHRGWSVALPTGSLDFLFRSFPGLTRFAYDGLVDSQVLEQDYIDKSDLPAVLDPFVTAWEEPPVRSAEAEVLVPKLRNLQLVLSESSGGFLPRLRDSLRLRAGFGLALDELYIGWHDQMQSDQLEEEYRSTVGGLKELVRGTLKIDL